MLREEVIEFFVADIRHLTGIDTSLFVAEPLLDIAAGFYTRREHPLMQQANTYLVNLIQYPIVSPQHRTHLDISSILQKEKTDKKVTLKQIRCNDLGSFRNIVKNSDAGLITELKVQRIKNPVCKVALVTLPGRTPSMAASRVSSEIRYLLDLEKEQ